MIANFILRNVEQEATEMEKSNSSKSGGIGFTGLLQLVFITLKLLKVIDWPWIWVLAPIWITVGFGILIIVVIVIVILIEKWNKK
jgi:hypothetical protein